MEAYYCATIPTIWKWAQLCTMHCVHNTRLQISLHVSVGPMHKKVLCLNLGGIWQSHTLTPSPRWWWAVRFMLQLLGPFPQGYVGIFLWIVTQIIAAVEKQTWFQFDKHWKWNWKWDRLWARQSRVQGLAGKRDLSLPHNDLHSGVMGSEFDHSPASSAKVKNEWSCTYIPLYSFMSWTKTLPIFNWK